MQRTRPLCLALAVVLGASLAGCSSSSKSSSSTTTAGPTTTAGGGGVTVPPVSGTIVHVTLGDTKGLGGRMTLVASKAVVPAGKVTFEIKNTGTIEHELVVLKLVGNEVWNKLPTNYAGDPPAPVASGGNKVSEAHDVADTGTNLKAGESRNLTATLQAGKYVMVCNIAKHYSLGMRAPLTVTG